MMRVLLPLLLILVIAVAVAYLVRSGRPDEPLRELSDQAIELAMSHRELEGDAELASLVLKRAIHVDDALPADLLLLAEEHLEASPALAWAITDAARAARKQLP